ncbi:uncharacterized protein LOC131875125 [Cryptomeria japonica]|uniref:uncharacterized protein LOC131875125 n=1 Tax=Cryptomeria japonica TaxID=3369 RepID=UPI0027D9F4BA|nr:uncharacterized protein LOC131875125 [Cryptomeria japonica]
MDISFGNLRNKIIVIYLDDLTIFSRKRKHHLRDLRKVLMRCREHGVSLNPKKSVFGVTKGKLLRHIVSKEGVKVDPERVKAIQQLNLPSNKNGVRSFFGQVNFLRRFIPDFAKTTKYIVNTMSENVVFKWNEEGKRAFEEIKREIAHAPTLVNPDFSKDFIIYCYASEHTMSRILVQKVKSILTQQDVGINNRASWVSKIQEFNLDIKPTKLFRGQGLCKLMAESKFEEEESLPLTLFVNHQDSWFTDVAYYLTYGDYPGYLSLREKQNLKLKATKYVIFDDILYKKGLDDTFLRCVDKPHQEALLKTFHNEACGGHFSSMVIAYKILRNYYYWPGMFRDVYAWVARCEKRKSFIGKKQAKIKEEKLDFEAAHSIGGRVTRSRYKKNFQPLAAHLILYLDAKEAQGNMTTPVSDANKVVTDVDTNVQDS